MGNVTVNDGRQKGPTSLAMARVRLDLRHTFRIARSADEFREAVLVRLVSGGLEGLGEAAPSPRYGQSATSAERALRALPADLVDDPAAVEETIARAARLLGPEKAALAAIDLALRDLQGKRIGAPLHRQLGLDPARTPATSYTIGIDTPEIIEEKVREAADFPALKVKMGLENDREILETVRRLTDRPIRVDANEGWTRGEAIEKVRWLEGQNVELIEQPLPAADREGMRILAGLSRIPLFADEAVGTADDVPALEGLYQGINIKLMKCGGIGEALRMIRAARERGLLVMLGCMIESSVGITAAAQISPLADFADLDGNILITNDPAVGVTVERGKLILPPGNGLGVTLREATLPPLR